MPPIEFIALIGLMLLMLVFMTRSGKKQMQRQKEQRDAAIVVGNNVVTTTGFLGKIVDIDGDTVTLQSLSGVETLWLRNSIMAQMDPPFAESVEELETAEDLTADAGRENLVAESEVSLAEQTEFSETNTEVESDDTAK